MASGIETGSLQRRSLLKMGPSDVPEISFYFYHCPYLIDGLSDEEKKHILTIAGIYSKSYLGEPFSFPSPKLIKKKTRKPPGPPLKLEVARQMPSNVMQSIRMIAAAAAFLLAVSPTLSKGISSLFTNHAYASSSNGEPCPGVVKDMYINCSGPYVVRIDPEWTAGALPPLPEEGRLASASPSRFAPQDAVVSHNGNVVTEAAQSLETPPEGGVGGVDSEAVGQPPSLGAPIGLSEGILSKGPTSFFEEEVPEREF